MAVVSLGATAVAIPGSYLAAFENEGAQLSRMARTRAALIGALGRVEAELAAEGRPEALISATLAHLRETPDEDPGFGDSGEIAMARREGDEIVFLLADRLELSTETLRLPWHSTLDEPMRRALRGESGVLVGEDYRGRAVLAAHEPIPSLGLGVVAKVDLAEVRAPFVRAALTAAGMAALLVLLGVGFLWRLTTPLLAQIERRQAELLEAETVGRHHAEELASESASRTRTILDTAVDSIITIDERGVIESANRAAVEAFGYAEEELLGKNVSMLMPPPFQGEHDSYLANYLATGQPRIIGIGREVPCRRKDGSIFPGDLAVSELPLHDRRCFTGILRDLSERKAAQRDLEAARTRIQKAEELAAVGTLVAGLAHEIGTPMGVIQGHAKLLEKAVEGDKARWRLQTIQEQIARISKIIQALLNMARPKATERVPVELERLIDTTLLFVAEKFKRRGIEVIEDLEPLPSVTGDPERLQQLLLNLLLNAADAMPKGGKLRVSLRRDGASGASIRIADTGIGIEPENLPRIFDAFYTSKAAGMGSGLGLMVASRIVADHGGKIEVESTPGEGSEFHVRLPWSWNG
jgi:two-component system sensor kinase FixL